MDQIRGLVEKESSGRKLVREVKLINVPPAATLARFLSATLVLSLFCPNVYAQVDSPSFAKSLKASLIFERSPEEPSHLHVVLHLVDLSDRTLTWSMNRIGGVDAQLFDPSGKPTAIPKGGMDADLVSGPETFTIGPHGKLDVLISHNYGISVVENPAGRYFVEVGNRLWFVPIATAASYTLHVRLQAKALQPGRESSPPSGDWPDVPPAKIVVVPEAN